MDSRGTTSSVFVTLSGADQKWGFDAFSTSFVVIAKKVHTGNCYCSLEETMAGEIMSPTNPTLTPPNFAPYLFYDDVDRAACFLEEAFGFRRIFESADPTGGLAHAQLSHG